MLAELLITPPSDFAAVSVSLIELAKLFLKITFDISFIVPLADIAPPIAFPFFLYFFQLN